MNTPTLISLASHSRPGGSDWRGLGDLIELATERLTAPVEGVHLAIADRWFMVAGRSGSRGHAVQSAVTANLYGSVRLVGSVTGAALGIGATAVGAHRPIRPLWNTSIGAGVQAAANALWGDEFEHRTSPMTTRLGIRGPDGATISKDAPSLAQAFPGATHRLAVLLHGLGKTERCWSRVEDDQVSVSGLPTVLEAEGFTPVFVRYNTGRRVSDNGSGLADLLEEIVTNWPVVVDEIVLIGHSMGGLVARSSVYQPCSTHHDWVERVRHIVTLGTPHFGSPIEKSVHLASRLLDTSTVTRPLSEFVDERSDGIKDMRNGTIDTTDPRHEIHNHHVAGVVTGDTFHPVGALVGDLVVRVNSATGRSPDRHIPSSDVRVFGGLNHLGMLHDPSVHEQIRAWLRPLPGKPTEGES